MKLGGDAHSEERARLNEPVGPTRLGFDRHVVTGQYSGPPADAGVADLRRRRLPLHPAHVRDREGLSRRHRQSLQRMAYGSRHSPAQRPVTAPLFEGDAVPR